uniref:DOMON domain-containing protein n=1 Tax=Romanomermis culicivorax TaxID=13658 RepID=A0A915KXS5_ROMCU
MLVVVVVVAALFTSGRLAQNTIGDLKTNCNKGKFCQSKPANCDPQTNCIYFLSYAPNPADKTVTWELLGDVGGSNQKYIALGLSKDQSMGDDALIYCAMGSNVAPIVGLAGNPVGHSSTVAVNDPLLTVKKQLHFCLQVNSNVQLTGGGLTGTKLWCRVVQKITPTVNSSYVWNLNGGYYFLMASGKFDSKSSKFGIHATGEDPMFPYVSNSIVNPVLATTTTSVSSASSKNCVSQQAKQKLVKAHEQRS